MKIISVCVTATNSNLIGVIYTSWQWGIVPWFSLISLLIWIGKAEYKGRKSSGFALCHIPSECLQHVPCLSIPQPLQLISAEFVQAEKHSFYLPSSTQDKNVFCLVCQLSYLNKMCNIQRRVWSHRVLKGLGLRELAVRPLQS